MPEMGLHNSSPEAWVTWSCLADDQQGNYSCDIPELPLISNLRKAVPCLIVCPYQEYPHRRSVGSASIICHPIMY